MVDGSSYPPDSMANKAEVALELGNYATTETRAWSIHVRRDGLLVVREPETQETRVEISTVPTGEPKSAPGSGVTKGVDDG